MNQVPNTLKRALFEAMLVQEDIVQVFLDATKADVPAHMKITGLCLEYGLNTPVLIPDLRTDDKGISATLSFNQAPCLTFVPWEAVFVICDVMKMGMVFYADIPVKVATALKEESVPEPTRGWVPRILPGGNN